MQYLPLKDYLAAVAAKTSTPGGGAVAAVSGCQAVSLMAMVCEFTQCQSDADNAFIAALLTRANRARVQFIRLAQEDMDAFNALMLTYKLPKAGEEGRQRMLKIQAALNVAAMVPQAMMTLGASFSADLARLQRIGNQNLVTDTGTVALLLTATILAAEMNVLINIKSITDASSRQGFLDDMETDKQSLPQLDEIAQVIVHSLHGQVVR